MTWDGMLFVRNEKNLSKLKLGGSGKVREGFMGYSTGVQRNEIMRERSEGGVIFFLFHYLGKKEGGEAGHWKTEMGRSGARGFIIPIFTQFHPFRPLLFSLPHLLYFSLFYS